MKQTANTSGAQGQELKVIAVHHPTCCKTVEDGGKVHVDRHCKTRCRHTHPQLHELIGKRERLRLAFDCGYPLC